MPKDALAEPWRSFLNATDSQLTEPADLHCLGGFVVADRFDLTRTTADLDVLQTVNETSRALSALAGRGTCLHATHRVYIDIVAMAIVPEHYEWRLVELHPGMFRHLRLRALEVHDLVLAKLTRNIDRDREDVRRLARYPGLDATLLEQRYRAALSGTPSRPRGHDTGLVARDDRRGPGHPIIRTRGRRQGPIERPAHLTCASSSR